MTSDKEFPEAALTRREREVLTLAQAGLTNQEIAVHLGISRNAVRYHLKVLHSKLYTESNRESLLSRALHALIPKAILRPAFLGPAAATLAIGAVSAGGLLGVLYANGLREEEPTTMGLGNAHGEGDYCVAEMRPKEPGEETYPDLLSEHCFATAEEADAFLDSLGTSP